MPDYTLEIIPLEPGAKIETRSEIPQDEFEGVIEFDDPNTKLLLCALLAIDLNWRGARTSALDCTAAQAYYDTYGKP